MGTPKSDTVDSLPGLGPKSAAWLNDIGINSVGELREAGAAVAFLRVRQAGYNPSRNLLWALQGALSGKLWSELTAAEKRALEEELAGLGES